MMEICEVVVADEAAGAIDDSLALAGGEDSVSGRSNGGTSGNAVESCSDCGDKSAPGRIGDVFAVAAAAAAAAAAASEYAAIFSDDRSLSFGRQLGSVRLRLLGNSKFSNASSLISEASSGDSGGATGGSGGAKSVRVIANCCSDVNAEWTMNELDAGPCATTVLAGDPVCANGGVAPLPAPSATAAAVVCVRLEVGAFACADCSLLSGPGPSLLDGTDDT
jgi:hypothetical protein